MEIDDDLIEQIEEFLDDQADCDCVGDPPRFVGNRAMNLLTWLRDEKR